MNHMCANDVNLSIRNLHIYYFTLRGVLKAVRGVSLDVNKKEIVGLIGESGCGKSTIGLGILRLIRLPGKIVEGKILFEGRNLLELTESEMKSIRGQKISMVFQDPMSFLDPLMKGGDQIAEAILLHQAVKKRDVKSTVIDIMKEVGIASPSEAAKSYPHQLSGGMRQRIVIATALSCNPLMLIADEPTTALDVTIQAQVLELIQEKVKKSGISLLLITHDLGIVADICDKVYVMYAGKIVEHAPTLSIYKNPKHPYTIGLLESVLSIDEYKQELKGIDGIVPDLITPPKGCSYSPRCPQTQKSCLEQEPPLVEVEAGHWVSCWNI